MSHLLLRDEDEICAILDRHHEATANKNLETLVEVFSYKALFVGTDDDEQWTLEQLVRKLKASASGWDMTDCRERHVYAVPEQKNVATFFEVVNNKKYGLMRGSGTVIKDEDSGKWRIVHYVLSFSVPNEVVDKTNLLKLLAGKKNDP